MALRKVEFVSPISLARWFISPAKASSEPAMFSAMVIAASLPDCTISPRSRSDILMRLLTCANIDEPPPPAPPRCHASSVTVNSVSIERRPDFSASNTMSVVISLAMLAGEKRLVGGLLEQHRAGIGVDQDRVRRRGLEALRGGAGEARAERAGGREKGEKGPAHHRSVPRLSPGRKALRPYPDNKRDHITVSAPDRMRNAASRGRSAAPADARRRRQ